MLIPLNEREYTLMSWNTVLPVRKRAYWRAHRNGDKLQARHYAAQVYAALQHIGEWNLSPKHTRAMALWANRINAN